MNRRSLDEVDWGEVMRRIQEAIRAHEWEEVSDYTPAEAAAEMRDAANILEDLATLWPDTPADWAEWVENLREKAEDLDPNG